MGKNEITFDMWMAELDRQGLLPKDNEGQTTNELAECLDCSRELVLRQLKIAKRVNRLAIGRAKRTSIDGRDQWVPVYRFLVKPKISKKG